MLFFWSSVGFIYGQDTILMFTSHEQTYYSEFVVMNQALQAAGYIVDVRSASDMDVSTYMVPSNTTIDATANTLSGSSYEEFTNQFESYFGSVWNPAWNPTPDFVPVNGRIQDVVNMSSYKAIVVVGGIGAQDYKVDGTYFSQGTGPRLLPSTEVQAASEKLNALAIEALQNGKPVLGQCHGAGIPAFWRVPGTSGTGEENIGFSILKNSIATGFPEPSTGIALSSLNIIYRENDPVVIGSPHQSLETNGQGDHKIITTRDWYPQTVAHAARTLINILESYPVYSETDTIHVLIIHGGAVNGSNCHYTNRMNDIPCNYGGGGNLPADYQDIVTLLQADSVNDDFVFSVTDVNITGNTLPFDLNNECSVFGFVADFDVVIFYKHWSTGVTVSLQNALVSYADNGGGVIALHHGLYNDIDPGGFNKNIIINSLFKAESAMSTWSANRTTYNLFATNYGHFISTWGLSYPTAMLAPAAWSGNPLHESANTGFAYYQRFSLFDEIYNNMTFVGSPLFGRDINMITPLWSNNLTPSGQCHVSGFTRRFDQNMDGIDGKVVYLQPGETKANYSVTHTYGQTIRNAIIWAGINNTVINPKIIWIAGTGNWTTGLNWDMNRIPRPCDEVIIPDQPNEIIVTIPPYGNHVIKSLTVGNNVRLIITNPNQLIVQY
ncbi:MAG: hypothetical protein H7X99_11865 [Saprospiraceae bacterium]|nr:hypothetical protein [Saprospiraceae bacterium]